MPQQCLSMRHASPRHRQEMARRARLCFVCLEPWHYASECKRGRKTEGKLPVQTSTLSSSASESLVAEQKTTVSSEEPLLAPVHANLATRSHQPTCRCR
ncbi:hypothetical protein T08_5487 [Trichinella sp. T8]|nr:hypothetical protein T08_5487 [Trichinella sp. T8]